MNILFLTLTRFTSIDDRGIYIDLMRKFRDEGHQVYIVAPSERRYKEKTAMKKQEGVNILNIWTLNIQKTTLIEKGIGTVLIEYQFLQGIKRYFRNVRFDLVTYSTPPITFTSAISKIKKGNNAICYLLLKDIFPQNAVDLGMFKNGGLIHKYFRRKEKILYRISDYIGCMSPANVNYVRKHNPEINIEKIEENPNSIKPVPVCLDESTKILTRKQIGLPIEKTIFIYGGNLGKPQGVDFLLETIDACKNIKDAFFLIVGSGTEYARIEDWILTKEADNCKIMKGLNKEEYDMLVASCDIGLIFLDKRFTIPNYPSRLLSYLENCLPLLAATDAASDLGKIAVENGYGCWAHSGDIETMKQHIKKLTLDRQLVLQMGKNGYEYLIKKYTVDRSYEIILKHVL